MHACISIGRKNFRNDLVIVFFLLPNLDGKVLPSKEADMIDRQKVYRVIIKTLVESDTVTVASLCEAANVSDKTIRNCIADVNLELDNKGFGHIDSKQGTGIRLVANNADRVKLKNLIAENDTFDEDENNSRLFKALKVILQNKKNQIITTNYLSNYLYLSAPTTLKVVQECRDWLDQFSVDLCVDKKDGISLHSDEVSYRLAVKHFLTKLVNKDEIDSQILYFMPSVDLGFVKKCIITAEKEWHLKLADESFNDTLVYVCLAIHRKSMGKNIEIDKEESKLLKNHSEYGFARKVFELCEIDIEEFENEISFLSIQILCSKVIDCDFSRDTKKMLVDFNNKLDQFIEKLIIVISNVLNVDLTKDKDLVKGLQMHLRPCIFRLKYDRGQNCKLTEFVRNEYRRTFKISWIVSVLFEEYFDLKVTEDELNYIVIYIQSAIERNAKSLNVALVTSSGMGINQMIHDKLKRNFVEFKHIKVISFHEYSISKIEDMDLIITTNQLAGDERIVEIDEFLSEDSIARIRNKISELDSKPLTEKSNFNVICHQLFEPDLIFTNMRFESLESVIKNMCEKLSEKGYVTKKYYKTVLDREEKNSTFIGNNCATPHGDQKEVNISKVCVTTLAQPIKWNEDMVDVVFLLVVKTDTALEIKKTQTFCREYLSLVETTEQVEKLRMFKNSIDLYKYLIQ